MEFTEAVSALLALGHEGRLGIFQLLVRSGSEGIKAGEIAEIVSAPQSSLSTNLSVLARAGLIAGRRDGRTITYTVQHDRVRDLLSFLIRDCCGGRPEFRLPLADWSTSAIIGTDDKASI